jgi:hypothetical protein
MPQKVPRREKEVDGVGNICYVLKDGAEMFLFRCAVL